MAVEVKISTQIGVLDIPNFSRGKQAQCIKLNGWGQHTGDVILKVAGEGKGFTRDEVDLLIDKTKQYREELEVAGVRTPKSLGLMSEWINEEYQVIMVDEFAGNGIDAKQALQQKPELAPQIVEKMVEFIHDLPSGTHPFKTAVMGDFKPDNWVYDDGKLIFIDYFAPKLFNGQNGVFPYLSKIDSLTPQAINFLCGDRRGMITRLLAILSRDHAEYLDHAVEIVKREYVDMPKVLDYALSEYANGFKKVDSVYKLKPKDMAMKI